MNMLLSILVIYKLCDMKNIRYFTEESIFENSKCSLKKDTILFAEDTKTCFFEKGAYFKCIYNITTIDEETTLIKSVNGIINMSIDGQDVDITTSYKFDTLGTHKVLFYIDKCTLLQNNPSFNSVTNLIEIYFPKNVKRINDGSFCNCTSLKKVIFDTNAQTTNWGCNPFTGCTSLEEFTMPIRVNENICGDSGGSFKGCTSLKKFTIPKNSFMTKMDKYLLSGATSVEEIRIEDGANINLNGAFSDLTNLKRIYIGDSVTNGVGSIYRRNLEEVVVSKNNTKYDSRDNCNAIIETATNKLIVGGKTTIIPNTVEIIGGSAFSLINDLKTINIPDSVTTIEDYGLAYGDYLTGVTIGSGITSIGDEAFYKQTKLSSIRIYAKTAPTLGEYVFTLCKSSGVVYYPKGSDYSSWKSADRIKQWSFIEFEP